MTVIYTETSLLSDPIFHIEDQSASFTVAFSSLVLQCRVHREENIRYLRENDLRTGDMIRLHGVFVTNSSQHYIKINSFSLMNGVIGKKRKIDDMNISSNASVSSSTKGETLWVDNNGSSSSHNKPSLMSLMSVSPGIKKRPLASVGKLTELDLEFGEYFFILYGRAHFVIDIFNKTVNNLCSDQANSSDYKLLISTGREKCSLINDMLAQIYDLFDNLSIHGLNPLNVVNFVNTVNSFIEKLTVLQKTLNPDYFPAHLHYDYRVPLPSKIYDYYVNH